MTTQTSENRWVMYWKGKSVVRFPTKADAEAFKKRHSEAMQPHITIRRER